MIPDLLSISLSPKLLDLIIFPTEKCNFRCTYCYEDFQNGKMSRDTINSIKKLIKNRIDNLHLLSISWFGGEPLLAKDIIYEISEYIIENKKESLNFNSNITTNAYLLDKTTFIKLCKCNISRFQVSIDGMEDIHNNTRKLANGLGSYGQIIKNLKSIRDETNQDVTIIIRLHYSLDTLEELEDTIIFLKNEFSSDKRFKILIKSLKKLGGNNDNVLKNHDYSSEKLFVNNLKYKLGLEDFSYQETVQQHICYASRANSFAIRSTGELAKCTVALNHPMNRIGKLNSDGLLSINDNKIKLWINGLQTNDPIVLACPYTQLLEAKKLKKIPAQNL